MVAPLSDQVSRNRPLDDGSLSEQKKAKIEKTKSYQEQVPEHVVMLVQMMRYFRFSLFFFPAVVFALID